MERLTRTRVPILSFIVVEDDWEREARGLAGERGRVGYMKAGGGIMGWSGRDQGCVQEVGEHARRRVVRYLRDQPGIHENREQLIYRGWRIDEEAEST